MNKDVYYYYYYYYSSARRIDYYYYYYYYYYNVNVIFKLNFCLYSLIKESYDV